MGKVGDCGWLESGVMNVESLLLGLGKTPADGLLGLGGRGSLVGVTMMMLKLRPLPGSIVLHGQSLSLAVAVLLQSAVLSVVLDFLAS